MAKRVAKKWIRGSNDRLAIKQGCWFDRAAGEFACDFIETFCRLSRHRRGEGDRFRLIAWQRDVLMRLFGWKKSDGTRRYRSCYVEIPKKNGKSALCSALALLLLVADGEPGPEVYCLAYDRSQAAIVFGEAMRMVKASPDLKEVLRIIPSTHTIVFEAGNGKLEGMSADVPSKDGFSPHGAIFDELHRQKTRHLWDLFEYADVARDQPIRIVITTAGDRRDSICFEQHDYSEKVIAGTIPDITHLAVIYGAGPKDDLDSPKVWRKANPSLGHTITEERFALDHARAKKSPLAWKNFKRLRLNVWGEAADKFLELGRWLRMARSPGSPLTGSGCYGGLDLASTEDLAAYVVVVPFEDVIRGRTMAGLDVLPLFWLPRETAELREEQRSIPYAAWAAAGWLKLTEGSRIDYEVIEADIVELHRTWPLLRGYSDPWNASAVVGNLREKHGLPFESLRQGFASLSEPTKEVERLIVKGAIRQDGNEVMGWCCDNAMAVTDGAGNVKLDKGKSSDKIDGMAALVDAVAAYLAGPYESGETSVYAGRGMVGF